MAVMVLSNLAATSLHHSKLSRNHVVEADFRAALDEKGFYDSETVQFGLLTISNLASSRTLHLLIVNSFLDLLIRFTRYRYIKC
jgi:preprotein translocase subunit SecB